MTLEELTTPDGRIKYLKILKENLDKDDATQQVFEVVITGVIADLQILDFYKHKFGKISLKEFTEYNSQKHDEENEQK